MGVYAESKRYAGSASAGVGERVGPSSDPVAGTRGGSAQDESLFNRRTQADQTCTENSSELVYFLDSATGVEKEQAPVGVCTLWCFAFFTFSLAVRWC